MKHTPGPWYVERDGNYPFMTTYICGAELGGRLADLHPPNVGGKRVIAANAVLMAAAPRLLAELEKATALLLAMSDKLNQLGQTSAAFACRESMGSCEETIIAAKGGD